MANKTAAQHTQRARRFSLRLPVYFRQLDSPTWLQGTTENISYTGMLFLASTSLGLESLIDLKVALDAGATGKNSAVVLCKGVVVRQEQSGVQESPFAHAVVMQDSRIVREPAMGDVLWGVSRTPSSFGR